MHEIIGELAIFIELLFPPLIQSLVFSEVCWKPFRGTGTHKLKQKSSAVEGKWVRRRSKHSSQGCHRLMITYSVRIPEGGLFLKKLMLPDACLGAIKDVSPKFIWSSWVLMMKRLCCTSDGVCLAFPNPAVILGNGWWRLTQTKVMRSRPLNRSVWLNRAAKYNRWRSFRAPTWALR